MSGTPGNGPTGNQSKAGRGAGGRRRCGESLKEREEEGKRENEQFRERGWGKRNEGE